MPAKEAAVPALSCVLATLEKRRKSHKWLSSGEEGVTLEIGGDLWETFMLGFQIHYIGPGFRSPIRGLGIRYGGGGGCPGLGSFSGRCH